MHALCICLLVVSAVSAGKWEDPKIQQFRFFKELGFMFRRSAETSGCILCYGSGSDCIAMNIYRCEYYVSTSDIVDNAESLEDPVVPVPELRSEVDTMMFDLVDKASKDPRNKDCIPFISHFTDCTRENVCVGCKTCECDAEGTWNCTAVQKCRVDAAKLHEDHRTLVMVLENLRSDDTSPSRVKRADEQTPTTKRSIISYEQLAEWMYGEPISDIRTDNSSIAMSVPGRSTTDLLVAESTTIGLVEEVNKKVLETESSETLNETDISKISFAEISEWVNDFRPAIERANASIMNSMSIPNILPESDTSDATTVQTVSDERNQTQANIQNTTTRTDSENVNFEEVLHSLIVENKTNIRRRPPLDVDHKEVLADHDYMNYDEYNFELNDQFLHITDPVTDGSKMTETAVTKNTRSVEEVTNAVTEIVIDLLESEKVQDALNYRTGKNIVFTDYYDLKDNDYKPRFEETNNIDQLETVNIMKRDISFVTETNVKTITTLNNSTANYTNNNFTFITLNNTTENIQDLRNLRINVLQPLKSILNDKHKELNELLKIQQSLIVFLNHYKDLDLSSKDNNTKKEPIYAALNKLEDTPVNPYNLRTSNTTLLEKYSAKLKRDVYEVIRDIVGIRQLSDARKIPGDLKFLMRAMKYYVFKQNFYQNKSKSMRHRNSRRKIETYDDDDFQLTVKSNSYEQTNIHSRRKLDSRDQSDMYTKSKLNVYDQSMPSDCVKGRVIKIIQAIDRNMPLSNSLNPLSRDAKKVIKRIIKQHYADEFAVVGLRVYDPHYNLTNDLRNIGTKWQDMAAAIKNSAPSDKLYAMKLLHLELSTDINKLNDALALINFAHTRRMVPVEENVGENIMGKISSDLIDIGKQISSIFNEDNSDKQKLNTLANPTRKPKMSFLKQIKHLLKSSKNDILGLLRKKIPKSEIFKELARKQLDVITRRKLTDYEQTMQKWQYNLGIVTPRSKRSVPDFDKMRHRIKNILPKYLRGKVPARPGKVSKKNTSKKSNSTAHKTKKTAITTKTKVTTSEAKSKSQ